MAKGKRIAIVGCMFAGKTEELFRRLTLEKFAERKTVVFKHTKDTRCPPDRIETHDGRAHPATSIADTDLLYSTILAGMDVVAIDEVQFFDPDILNVIRALTDAGIDVFATGLTTDFRGQPYKHVPQLMAIADEVTILTAVCMKCKRKGANRTQLLAAPPAEGQDKVGGKGMYEARCRDCHEPPP